MMNPKVFIEKKSIIYSYNHNSEDFNKFTSLSDFLHYLNENDANETYSTSKKRLTDALDIDWEKLN